MPAYVPKSEFDLFISYAHLDNYEVGENPGWVSTFVKDFKRVLTVKLGAEPLEFFDGQEIRKHEDFNTRIENGISNSTLFCAIVSPSYANSHYCAREWNYLRDKHSGEVKLHRGSRCLEIIAGIPDGWKNGGNLVQDSEGFTFHDATGPLRRSDPNYITMLGRLANDTKKTLDDLRDLCPSIVMPRPSEFKFERAEWSIYNLLNGLFHKLGYRVIPRASFLNLDELQAALPSAKASVYFLGENERQFEQIVTNAVKSGKDVTVILASNRDSRKSFAWPLVKEKNVTFRTASAVLYDELAKGFQQRLISAPQPDPPPSISEQSIYLMCDETSDVTVKRWVERIHKSSYSLVLPDVGEDSGQGGGKPKKTIDIKEEIKRILGDCSKVVLVWGSQTNLNSFRQKIKLIKDPKVAEKPRVVHLPPPKTPEKDKARIETGAGSNSLEAHSAKKITVIEDDDDKKIDKFLEL